MSETFVDTPLVECQTCKDWGRTVTKEECHRCVPCPTCHRLTWANQGVNVAAGDYWSYCENHW